MQVQNPEDISSSNEEDKSKRGRKIILSFLIISFIVLGALYYNFKIKDNAKTLGETKQQVKPKIDEKNQDKSKEKPQQTENIDTTVYKDSVCNNLPANRRKDLYFENKKEAKILTFIACSDQDKQDGLIGVFQLADNHGMLFVFEKTDNYKFWMRDTSLYLSVAFLNKDQEIMEIIDPEPLSEERFGPDNNKTKYVLEVNKGWFKENNIKVGDKLNLE